MAGEEIAGGHALGKHLREFNGLNAQSEFAAHIESIIANPSDIKFLAKGRIAYWGDASQTVVIRNPSAQDGGTVFKPKHGKSYFDNLK